MRSLTGLKFVEFRGANVTDDVLAEVATLPLEEISIIAEPITDKSVRSLARMKTLKEIRIEERCGVSTNALAQLKKALPEAVIETVQGGRFEDLEDNRR